MIYNMNAISIIHPYWKHGTWCFTDENKGLTDEPFVAGADIFISMLLVQKGILMNAEKGFNLTFSDTAFPDYDVVVKHILNEQWESGNWYIGELGGQKHKLWLCPALLKYFDTAPAAIYAKFTI